MKSPAADHIERLELLVDRTLLRLLDSGDRGIVIANSGVPTHWGEAYARIVDDLVAQGLVALAQIRHIDAGRDRTTEQKLARLTDEGEIKARAISARKEQAVA